MGLVRDQRIVRGVERGVRGVFAHGEAHAVSGGDADEGGAAYTHDAYGFGGALRGVDRAGLEGVREQGLVDELDAPAAGGRPYGAVAPSAHVHSRSV